jgi:N-sulfoglucosamine sulfohydrolase
LKPNILYLHSHDTGRLIQPYGYAVPTPNLQRLAEEGILFRKAYCASPTCSPSRACLLTGRSAHQNGMLGLAHRGFSLNDPSEHLIETLRQHGYSSTLIGIQHLAKDPQSLGYDRIIEPVNDYVHGVRGTECTVEKVVPGAEEFLGNAPAEPFFLSVGFYETHTVYHPPGVAEDKRYNRPPHPIPDTPGSREEMASFMSSARVLDQGIGRVLAALHESGLEENTLVICTTDHGPAFPGMKCSLTDHGLGVLLIMRGPGGFSGGKIIDALVSHLDLFPTVCDLLEIKPPTRLEGYSLLPLVNDEKFTIRDEIFSEINFHAAYEPQRAIRTSRWNYIRRFGSYRHPVLSNCDDGLAKDIWREHDWSSHHLPDEELYDLIFDPGENANLVGDEHAQSELNDLRSKLRNWMKANNDPLLSGPVPAPPGAELNHPESNSHREDTWIVGDEHSSTAG